MTVIMACDEASEESKFLSALNASLEHFVHKTLKAEQVECIRRIVCHGRDVLAVLTTGFGKSAIYQLIPKVLFNLSRTANAISKTTVAVVSPLDYIRNQQVASIEKMDCGSTLRQSIQGNRDRKWKVQNYLLKCRTMAWRSLPKSVAVWRSSSDKGPGCRWSAYCGNMVRLFMSFLLN